MDIKEFEELLHHLIPITNSMEFKMLEFTPEKVKVLAPLEPNINHKSTAFGGSINCLMTVCGWAIMFANFKGMFQDAHIVIQKSNINYLLPVNDDFYAECELKDDLSKEKLIKSFNKFGKGKLSLNVNCYCNGNLVAEYQGTFAIINL